jgi:uncharacterized protein (DUF983 family)
MKPCPRCKKGSMFPNPFGHTCLQCGHSIEKPEPEPSDPDFIARAVIERTSSPIHQTFLVNERHTDGWFDVEDFYSRRGDLK